MWWRVIFIGVVCLLLILVVTLLAVAARHDYPGFFTGAIILDVAVVLGGVKTILETTKTAQEVVNLGFEIQKTQLEIRNLRRDEERDGARVVIPTDEQVWRYGVPKPAPAKASKRALPALIAGAGALAVVAGIGIALSSREHTSPKASAPARVPPYLQPELRAYVGPPQSRANFTCGTGDLTVLPYGEILFQSGTQNLPPAHVTVRLREGSIIFPLIPQPGNLDEKRHGYVANRDRAIRFPARDARIEIDSKDGSLKLRCSEIKEDHPEQPSK